MPRLLAEVGHDRRAARDLHRAARRAAAGASLRTMLERARDRGEIRDDVDLELAIDMLVGPVIYRFMITGGDLGPAAARAPRVLEPLLERPQATWTRPLTTPRLRLPASSSSSSAPTSSRRQPRSVRTSGSGLPRRAATTTGARSARAAISS